MNQSAQEQIAQLEAAIAAQEALRATLGDAVVNATIATLREKLAELKKQATPSDQQRKQVTVLFADISGFTAMSETLDAEIVAETMNALWERVDAAIVAQSGLIDKHIGDAVMALWGAETAREDDPECAIRAALAMQQEIRSWRLEVGETSNLQPLISNLQMRIGINTGPVLLGEVGSTGEFTAMGDAVNLASRLEHAAPVGGILISHNTYQHVRGIFEVQALDPIQVKGKVKPIRVYVVQRAKPRAFRLGTRGVEGIETRMVGREAELKHLQDAFYTVEEDGERQMVTIVGEAGVGKSRLLYEFENWLERLPVTICHFKERASQELQSLPYALIRDLFSFHFQIQDSDPANIMRQKVEAGISGVLGADEDQAHSHLEEQMGAELDTQARPESSVQLRSEFNPQLRAHFIGQLLGFDFSASPYLQSVLDNAQQLHDRALGYLREFFEATTAQLPTVIFLEDIHWADDSSLDVINHLALTTAEQRLLIVCVTRPTLFERRPHWGEGQTFHIRLTLRPLSKRDSRRLVAEILQKVKEVPTALRDLVVSGAEGNPFYVEELLKMLIEDGVIVKEEERWRVEPSRLAQVRVPPTLTGVIQARLDSLTAEERTTLQRASVIGREFWDSAVACIGAPEGEQVSNKEALDALYMLWRREMIFLRETSAFAGTQEYTFKHAILRKVTYESVLKRLRRVYHGQIAEWLIEHSGERAGEYTGLIADHLESAGQTKHAVTYLRRAGEQAATQFANVEALNYFSRALDLASEMEHAIRYTLLLAREEVHDLLGKREAQRRDLEILGKLTEALDDKQRQAQIALRLAHYAEATSNYPTAIAAARAAIDLGQAVQDVLSEARGYLHWGRALWYQGDYEAARSQLEQALALAQSAGLRPVEADCLSSLGNVFWYQGNYAEAKVYFGQALSIEREIDDRQGEGDAFNNLACVSYEQGERVEAIAYQKQALRIYREIGYRRGEGLSLNNLGLLLAEQGDYTEAMTYYEQSLRICREIGDREGEISPLMNLGLLFLYQGQYAESKAYQEKSLQISGETGHRRDEAEGLIYLSLACHHLNDDESAQEHGQQALRIAQEMGDRRNQSYALTHLGHALAGLGHLAEAADAYRQAVTLRRELGEHHRAMESLAGLARVSLAQDNLPQAFTQVEEILSYLETNTPSEHSLNGTDEPFLVYLTCYRVLREASSGKASQDPRARDILTIAHQLLQERAAKISDPHEKMRRSFLEDVAAHRELVKEANSIDTPSTP